MNAQVIGTDNWPAKSRPGQASCDVTIKTQDAWAVVFVHSPRCPGSIN
jgi:hypothetical protein